MRSSVLLTLLLPLAWVLLVPSPALSQTTSSGADAQYGQDSTLGDRAAHDAMVALGAIQATSEEAQATATSSVSAAELPSALEELNAASAEVASTEVSSETQGEDASISGTQDESATTSDLEKLPDTGGPSPSWLGLPLVCVGVLLARRLFHSGIRKD